MLVTLIVLFYAYCVLMDVNSGPTISEELLELPYPTLRMFFNYARDNLLS